LEFLSREKKETIQSKTNIDPIIRVSVEPFIISSLESKKPYDNEYVESLERFAEEDNPVLENKQSIEDGWVIDYSKKNKKNVRIAPSPD